VRCYVDNSPLRSFFFWVFSITISFTISVNISVSGFGFLFTVCGFFLGALGAGVGAFRLATFEAFAIHSSW